MSVVIFERDYLRVRWVASTLCKLNIIDAKLYYGTLRRYWSKNKYE